MNVTILGGGNIGMCLAGEISRVKGYEVTLYASKPESFEKRIMVVDEEKDITFRSGEFLTTDDLNLSVQDADMVICTLPAFCAKT